VTAHSIIARPGCIIYNYIDEGVGAELDEGQVLAGVFNEGGSQVPLKSNTDIDGGKHWEERLSFDQPTFEQIYRMNATVDPSTTARQILAAHRALWKRISDIEPPLTIEDAQSKLEGSYWQGFAVGAGAALGMIAAMLVARGSKIRH
jgi:hypothetical protein